MHHQQQANSQHDSSPRDSSKHEAESDGSAAASAFEASAIDAARLEALLERFLSGDFDVAATAKSLGISIFALTQWVNEPRNAQTLECILRLQDFGSHSFLAHMTRPAIAQLVHISRKDDKPDIARKACVDLLKAAPGSTRSLNAARIVAMTEKARIEREETARNGSTAKRANSEVVKSDGPTGFAFTRPVVNVSEDNIRRMFEQMANGERPNDSGGEPKPNSPSHPQHPVRPPQPPHTSRPAQPPHSATQSKPCMITLRREPIMPRQDLGGTHRTTDSPTRPATKRDDRPASRPGHPSRRDPLSGFD